MNSNNEKLKGNFDPKVLEAKGYLILRAQGYQPKEYVDGKWIKYDLLGAEGLAEDFSTYYLGFCDLAKYDIDYLPYHSVIVDGFRACESLDLEDQFPECDRIVPLGDYLEMKIKADEMFSKLPLPLRLDRLSDMIGSLIPNFKEKLSAILNVGFLLLDKDQTYYNIFIGFNNGEFKKLILTDRAQSFGALNEVYNEEPNMEKLFVEFLDEQSPYLQTTNLEQLQTMINSGNISHVELSITDEDIDNYTNDCYPEEYVDRMKRIAKYRLSMNLK